MQVAILSAGHSFGELALISHKPRSATIKCITQCKFAVLSKKWYEKIFLMREKKKLIEKTSYLKDISFLKDVTKTKLSKITYFFKEREYIRGQTVYSEGELGQCVFIVKEGEFELQKMVSPASKKPIDYTEFLSQFPHNKNMNNKQRILTLSHPINTSEKAQKTRFHVIYRPKIIDFVNRKRRDIWWGRCNQSK
jgi:hypothetical protein